MSKIMNLITYDKLLKNITAIHINLICSDTFKILYEAAEKTASFMICFASHDLKCAINLFDQYDAHHLVWEGHIAKR